MITRKTLAEQMLEQKIKRATATEFVQKVVDEAFNKFVSLGDILIKLDIIEETLWRGFEVFGVLDDLGQVTQTEVPLSRERIASLKTIQDKNLRLLNKLVADKRAIEVTGEGPLFGRESREELEANLKRLGIDPIIVQATAALR